MFKNRNKMTKISNSFLLIVLVMSLISVASLAGNVFFNATPIEGYTKTDYIFNFVLMAAYAVFTTIFIVILNTKIDLYKDEYTTSKQLFNLLFVFAMLSTLVNITNLVVTYILYNEFSLMILLGIVFAYLTIYISAFIYVRNNDYLSNNNSKKTNVINFIVIYLLMEYSSSIINLLLKIVFKDGVFNDNIKALGISLVMVIIVLVAYKLLNRDNTLVKKNA